MTDAPSLLLGLRCLRCRAEYDDAPLFEGCPQCRDGEWAANLETVYDLDRAGEAWAARSGRGLWRYAAFLPVRDPAARTSLGEGATPIVRLEAGLHVARSVWLKYEALNPTWSYKDRLCAVAVSKGRESGAEVIGASSTGNHGASAAAYAARAGLSAVVLTRDDIDRATAAFMQVYGAIVLRTTRRGRWTLLRHGVQHLGWYPVSTYTSAPTGNPYGSDGYRTIAFELFEDLAAVPDIVIVPTSYGEGMTGIAAGFEMLRTMGLTERLPRMVAVEPQAGAPLAHALDQNLDRVTETGSNATVATSIGATTATDRALLVLRRTRGSAVRVNDEEILLAQAAAARQGVFLEPAGAAGLAALDHLEERLPDLKPDPHIVVVGTAGGLRQIDVVSARLAEVPYVEPDPAALEGLIRRAAGSRQTP